MDADKQQEIRDYIREHRGRYTRDAIRANLIAAGHDPAQVDAAWELEGGVADAEPPGGGLAGFALAVMIGGAVLGGLGALALMTTFFDAGSVPLFIVGFAVSYLGLGYGLYRLVRWAERRYALRGLGATLVGIALVPTYALLMFGTCVGASNLARSG